MKTVEGYIIQVESSETFLRIAWQKFGDICLFLSLFCLQKSFQRNFSLTTLLTSLLTLPFQCLLLCEAIKVKRGCLRWGQGELFHLWKLHLKKFKSFQKFMSQGDSFQLQVEPKEYLSKPKWPSFTFEPSVCSFPYLLLHIRLFLSQEQGPSFKN